jgi:hypothetical protein
MNTPSNTPPPMHPSPACASYAPLLPLLAHGLLGRAQAARVRAHLSTCTSCQERAALDDALDAALRHCFAPPDDAGDVPFSIEEIARMIDRPPSDERVGARMLGRATSRLRLALASTAAAILLVCLLAAGLFSRSGVPPVSGPAAGQSPAVGSSIDDLNQLGARIDGDLDQIVADQQAATTDNTQQDQVQP